MNLLLDQYAFIAVGILGLVSAVILLTRSWRWRVGALALQYVGVFWLVALSWPVGLASIKLVVGWMAGAILGVSRIDQLPSDRRRWPTEWMFLGLVMMLVFFSVSTIAPRIEGWLPANHSAQIWGGLLLIGSGLIHLGVASRGLRVIVSLLTALSGFEILYAVVENSTLVAGLLATVTLGIALVGAYLLSNLSEEVMLE
ncbi:MAG TPA: hypothetical protein VLA32_11770 [Anaerolineales bacterium]|jgi:hypothetical protein|nr:hypothetical protein [Anaerolineales bacterium]